MSEYEILRKKGSREGKGVYHRLSSANANFPNQVGNSSFKTIKFGLVYSLGENYSNKKKSCAEILVFGTTGNHPFTEIEIGTHYLGKLEFDCKKITNEELSKKIKFFCSNKGRSELERIAMTLIDFT